MRFLHILVAAAVLPVTVLAVGSCVETDMSVYITAEGQIRGSFVGLEHAQASEILTSCGMKCGCINDIFLCCSDIECIQMERKCNTEDRTSDVPNETIKFDSNGHHAVPKRSVLLEKVLSGRAAALRRDRRDSGRQITTMEATTVTATTEEEQEHPHSGTNEGSGSVKKGDANVGPSAVKSIERQRRSAGDEKIRVKREEEFMEDDIVTTTVESSSETTDAPEKQNRRKRSSDTLAQNLERKMLSVAGENIRVKREEEFMEDAIVTTTVESSSETTDAPDSHGSNRKKRSSDATKFDIENNDRSKRSPGEEIVRVRRDEEEFMEDAIVTTTIGSDSEPTDAPRKHGSDRKKREVVGEIFLTTETATTEHTDAEITLFR